MDEKSVTINITEGGTEEEAFLELMKMLEVEVTHYAENDGYVQCIKTDDGHVVEHRFNWAGDYTGISIVKQ